jgi:hypothetical protein
MFLRTFGSRRPPTLTLLKYVQDDEAEEQADEAEEREAKA